MLEAAKDEKITAFWKFGKAQDCENTVAKRT